jgi:hypothetical protein
MLGRIVAGHVMDFGYFYGGGEDFSFCLPTLKSTRAYEYYLSLKAALPAAGDWYAQV